MDDVLTELRLLTETLDNSQPFVRRHIEAQTRENKALWTDLAALRDELHEELRVQRNLLESAMRGLTTEPAEVAERMLRDADA